MKPFTPASGKELHDLFSEIFRLQHLLSQVIDQVHEQAGMRTPQKHLAEALQSGREMTVPSAAAEMGVSRQFVQTLSNEMAASGLLAFSDNPRHKRSKLISLTPQGREVLNTTQRIEAEIIGQAMPPVDGEAVRDATSLAATLSEWLGEAVENLGCSRTGHGAGEPPKGLPRTGKG